MPRIWISSSRPTPSVNSGKRVTKSLLTGRTSQLSLAAPLIALQSTSLCAKRRNPELVEVSAVLRRPLAAACELPVGFGPLVIQPNYAEVDSVECLATKLLSRGDTVSIELGQLAIQPASGKPVPPEWMDQKALEICRSVLAAVGVDAFRYAGYSTGRYGEHKSAGVTLRFTSVLTGETSYSIFNVDLARKRTTAGGKAGAPLPAGEFRVGERSRFYKFWLGTGLPLPERMQRFHKCMGKLSSILLAGEVNKDRLDVQSLQPLTITADQVRLAFQGLKEGTTKAQLGHKEGTRSGHKETAQTQAVRGLQPILTTCVSNYENKLIRKDDNKVSLYSRIPIPKPPQEQSVDEWLEAYSSP